eukprot:COSAG04_NODE_202_length_20432_cov_7.004525_2_plen_657_part_00
MASTDALADSAYAASATLTRLKSQLESSERERRALRAELDELRGGASRGDERAERSEADLRERESDLLRLRALVEQRDEEQAVLQATVAKKDERIAELRRGAKEQASASFAEAERLQAALRTEQQARAALEEEREAAQAEAQAAKAECERLKCEQSALAGGEMVVVQSMASELQAAGEARQQADSELAAAQAELELLRADHEAERARWESERGELTAQREQQQPPPPSEQEEAAQSWMAEKAMMTERLATAEKRAIDTMSRFLAMQGQKNALHAELQAEKGQKNALQAELQAEKEKQQRTAELSRAALTTLGDADANNRGQAEESPRAEPRPDGSPGPACGPEAAEPAPAAAPASPAPAMPASPELAMPASPAPAMPVSPEPEAGGLTPVGGDDEDEEEEELAQEDVEEYAQDVLGMVLPRDEEFLWIAEEALHQTELPSGWSEYEDESGRPYYNHPSQPHSTYEHPVDTYHKSLYEFHRRQATGAAEEDYADEEYTQAVEHLQHELALRSPAAGQAGAAVAASPAKTNPANFVDAFWWGATYKSWLSKKSGTVGAGVGHVRRNWNKRYFAIGAMGFPNRISWAKNPGKESASEYVEIDQRTQLIESDERKGGKKGKLRFCVQTQGRELWLEANSKSDKRDWLAMITAVMGGADLA